MNTTQHPRVADCPGAQGQTVPIRIVSGDMTERPAASPGAQVEHHFFRVHEALWHDDYALALSLLLSIGDLSVRRAVWDRLRDDDVDSLGPSFCRDIMELINSLKLRVVF